MRVLAPLLVIAGALAFATPAAAAKLPTGIYDCVGTASSYVSSVKIKPRGRYVFAGARTGRTLKQTTKGRYRVRGKKITWLKGTFKRAGYVSTIYDGYFSLDRKSDGKWTGISCYRQSNP